MKSAENSSIRELCHSKVDVCSIPMENPRGHQVGRMGKAVVMMIIMSMYMDTTQVGSGSRDLAPKLGSPVATAALR